MGWGRDCKVETISLQVTSVTWDFLEFMWIKIEEGRNFLPEDELKPNGIVIINRKAANEYNMEVGDKFTGHSGEGNAEIVGISSNFNYMTLSFDIKPFIFYIYGTRPWSFQNNLHFRIKQGADIKTTIDYVKKTVNNLYPDYPIDKLEVNYFDQIGRAHV